MAKYAELAAFYCSDAWRNFRMVYINERAKKDGGLICDHCKKRLARATEITLHHHPIELTLENYKDAMVALNPANILLVCHACHNALHKRNARIMERFVYIVYGPPMAGKKTFVRETMWPGDLIVDMDALFQAVSFQGLYQKPDILLTNVLSVQSLLLDNIKTRLGKWNSAWVIGGYPNKYKREWLADELGAILVPCLLTKEDCLRRLENDAERRHVSKTEWQGYIDKWFEQYVA